MKIKNLINLAMHLCKIVIVLSTFMATLSSLVSCNGGSSLSDSTAGLSLMPDNSKNVYMKNFYSADSLAVNTISAYDAKSNITYFGYIDVINRILHIQECQANKCNDLPALTLRAVGNANLTVSNSTLYVVYSVSTQVKLAYFNNKTWHEQAVTKLNKQNLTVNGIKIDSDENSNLYLFINYQGSLAYDFVVINPITQNIQQLFPNTSIINDVVMTNCSNGDECFLVTNKIANHYDVQTYLYKSNLAIGSNNPNLLNDSKHLLTNLADSQVSLAYSKQQKQLFLSKVNTRAKSLAIYSYSLDSQNSATWQLVYVLQLQKVYPSSSIITNHDDLLVILSPSIQQGTSRLLLFNVANQKNISYVQDKLLNHNLQNIHLMRGQTPSSYLASFSRAGTPSISSINATQLALGWNELEYDGIQGYPIPTIAMDVNAEYAYVKDNYGLLAYALNYENITNGWNQNNSFALNTFPTPGPALQYPLGVTPGGTLYALDGNMDHLWNYTPSDGVGNFSSNYYYFNFPYGSYSSFFNYGSQMLTLNTSNSIFSCNPIQCSLLQSSPPVQLLPYPNAFAVSSTGFMYAGITPTSGPNYIVSWFNRQQWTQIDNGQEIYELVPDNSGNVYGGWFSGVIEKYNQNTVTLINNPSTGVNTGSPIFAMYWDNASSLLYFSTMTGLWTYSPANGQFQQVEMPQRAPCPNCVITSLTGNALYNGASSMDVIEALIINNNTDTFSVWAYNATPQE